MPFAKLGELDIYYELHGSGQPMVLINGLKADHTGWAPVINNLAKDYQILVFDNRGAGQTKYSGEPFTIDTMANDTMALVKYLQLKKPYIVGHSLGGAITQTIAWKYANEISRVVLCNTFIRFSEEVATGFTKILELHENNASPGDIIESILPWVFSKSFITPELIKLVRKVSNENPKPQSLEGYRNQLFALKNFDSSNWVHLISVPALVIGSKEDIAAKPRDSEELAKKIPKAELQMLPGAHASAVEQPQLLCDMIKSYCNCLQ